MASGARGGAKVMSDRGPARARPTSAAREPHDADVDLVVDMRKKIRVSYVRPVRLFGRPLRLFGRIWWRNVRRTFEIRALPPREVVLIQESIERLRGLRGGHLDDAEVVAVIVGIDAM